MMKDQKMIQNYQFIKKVGEGAYGEVWKVKLRSNSKIYALKKIRDTFRNATEARRAYRQIKYLQRIQHPNIVRMQTYFWSLNQRDVYLCMQYVEADLNTAIKKKILQNIHKQYIFYQIANALAYLHSACLVHRDLKPSNVLLTQKCEVKICDFGLIRSLKKQQHEYRLILTQNIATRWYRSPEVLLKSEVYGKELDIWSLGCILMELYLQKTFLPGTSAASQLEKIVEITGIPTSQDLNSIINPSAFHLLNSINPSNQKKICQLLPNENKNLIDLLERIFQFNPNKRPKIMQILNHPFVSKFRINNPFEKFSTYPIKIAYDSQNLSVQNYRILLQNKNDSFSQSKIKTGKTSEMSTVNQSKIYAKNQNHVSKENIRYKSNSPSGLSPQKFLISSMGGTSNRIQQKYFKKEFKSKKIPSFFQKINMPQKIPNNSKLQNEKTFKYQNSEFLSVSVGNLKAFSHIKSLFSLYNLKQQDKKDSINEFVQKEKKLKKKFKSLEKQQNKSKDLITSPKYKEKKVPTFIRQRCNKYDSSTKQLNAQNQKLSFESTNMKKYNQFKDNCVLKKKRETSISLQHILNPSAQKIKNQ